MPRVAVRVVSVAKDAAVVASLRRAWTEEDAGPAGDAGFEAEFAEWWQRETGNRTTWAVFVDDDAVGMLNMAEFRRMPRPGRATGRWGYVANVFVLAAHRNAGLGGLLLEAALAEARSRGYARVVLNPSPRSIPFYRRAGFVAADELLVLPLPQ